MEVRRITYRHCMSNGLPPHWTAPPGLTQLIKRNCMLSNAWRLSPSHTSTDFSFDLPSEYKEIWEGDPFLRAGGDLKSSRRPKENFGEFFAREHALLAIEREAYIKGRDGHGL